MKVEPSILRDRIDEILIELNQNGQIKRLHDSNLLDEYMNGFVITKTLNQNLPLNNRSISELYHICRLINTLQPRIKVDEYFTDYEMTQAINNKNNIKIENSHLMILKIEFDVVKKAINEQVYIRTTMTKKGLVNETPVDILDGDYLVKATIGSTNKDVDNNRCNYGTFANRMSKYYTIVLQRSGLTNQRIYKSSVYYHMLKEYRRKLSLGELMDYLKLHDEKVSLSNTYREQEIMFKKMMDQGDI